MSQLDQHSPSSPEPSAERPSFVERYLAARSKTKWRRIGWTLIEMMMAISIMGMLAAIAMPSFRATIYQAQVGKAIGDISALQIDIATYEAKGNGLPETMGDVGRATLLDPWGNPYQYLNFHLDGVSSGGNGKGGGGGGHPTGARKDRFLVPINSFYDLYSMGADGKTVAALTAAAAKDDIVRANDGGFIGLGAKY